MQETYFCFLLIHLMNPIFLMKTNQCEPFYFGEQQQSLSFVGATKSGDACLLGVEEKPLSRVCWREQFRVVQF